MHMHGEDGTARHGRNNAVAPHLTAPGDGTHMRDAWLPKVWEMITGDAWLIFFINKIY
jgi:hypothetical protein